VSGTRLLADGGLETTVAVADAAAAAPERTPEDWQLSIGVLLDAVPAALDGAFSTLLRQVQSSRERFAAAAELAAATAAGHAPPPALADELREDVQRMTREALAAMDPDLYRERVHWIDTAHLRGVEAEQRV